MKRGVLTALVFALSALLSGCGDDFEPPSTLDSLRVLSVRAEPGSGTPGQQTSLSMLLVDEDEAPAIAPPREIDVLWLGGCHNPPGRQFYGCYPTVRAITAQLETRASDTDPGAFPPGVFGTGQSFSFTVPDGILEDAPRVGTDPIHFGVSFVFFAACAGAITPRPDFTDRVPLGCVDRQSGEAVPASDFVTGFSTVFTYEGTINENPRLDGLKIDGVPYTAGMVCGADTDCAPLGDYTCSAARSCVPSFEACPEEGDCRAHRVEPQVDPASAERLGKEHEILWVNYFTTAGGFASDTQLVSDRTTGPTQDPSGRWHPPRRPLESVRLWITLNDQRGGATWTSLDVAVRETSKP